MRTPPFVNTELDLCFRTILTFYSLTSLLSLYPKYDRKSYVAEAILSYLWSENGLHRGLYYRRVSLDKEEEGIFLPLFPISRCRILTLILFFVRRGYIRQRWSKINNNKNLCQIWGRRDIWNVIFRLLKIEGRLWFQLYWIKFYEVRLRIVFIFRFFPLSFPWCV